MSRINKYRILIEGMLIGAVTGVIVAFFRLALVWADHSRDKLVAMAHGGAAGAALAALLLLGIAVAVTALLAWEPECTGSGIPQVEGEMRGLVEQRWWSVLLAKFVGCVLSIGGGLALGREGPCVQLGSMVGKGFARTAGRELTEERLLITCGAGAGISAAFGAPLAGAIFALEELQKNFSPLILVTTMGSAAVGDYVVGNIIGLEPVFNIEVTQSVPLKLYWSIILLGVLLGVFGAFYNRILDVMQNIFNAIAGLFRGRISAFAKIATAFTLSYIMIFVYPTALGSGSGLVAEIATGHYALEALAIMLLVKFVYSTGSFGSGAPGGIFLPLLVLGAISGGFYSRALGAVFGIDQAYITAFAVMAMAGFFSAIVRAPATGIILITEMTGDFNSLLALVTVSLIAHVTAELCGAKPVYEQLLEKRLLAEGKAEEANIPASEDENTMVILRADVHVGSKMDGTAVKDFRLPEGSLIVNVNHRGGDIVPNGDTVLEACDHLEIICRKTLIDETIQAIQAECEVNL